MAKSSVPRIIGLHKLPFDRKAFEKDAEVVKGQPDEKELKKQHRENWENAWLIVVEYPGPASELEMDQFNHGDPALPRANRQAPWAEEVLSDSPDSSTIGFYMHYVNTDWPLCHGRSRLEWPAKTPAPAKLLKEVPYMSPD